MRKLFENMFREEKKAFLKMARLLNTFFVDMRLFSVM
jgi:hypothetical protein